jgi:hypothetical protein
MGGCGRHQHGVGRALRSVRRSVPTVRDRVRRRPSTAIGHHDRKAALDSPRTDVRVPRPRTCSNLCVDFVFFVNVRLVVKQGFTCVTSAEHAIKLKHGLVDEIILN